jgi:hypothetical protein
MTLFAQRARFTGACLLRGRSGHNNQGHQVFHLWLKARAWLRVDADKVN